VPRRLPGTGCIVISFIRYDAHSHTHLSRMIDRPRNLEIAPEREAEAIVRASEQELSNYVRRGMIERWLSAVVRCLDRLERQPRTRALARRALHRLGFPTA
jgi:hypothetical protein